MARSQPSSIEKRMQIWPAIDLLDGKCVRLKQGDYHRETVFSDDPVAMARQWQSSGARHLHLVDLDGARDGAVINRQVIADIMAAVEMECEVGGGIRDENSIRELIDLNVNRLVIGTSALKQPEWFRQMCQRYPHRLVLGIDARDGKVATDGWLETSQVAAVDLVNQFAKLPLAAVIYTDIATDGMMSGPNLEEIQTMAKATNHPVIASGGIRSVGDLQDLATVPVAGAIVGRALYENEIDLAAALAATSA